MGERFAACGSGKKVYWRLPCSNGTANRNDSILGWPITLGGIGAQSKPRRTLSGCESGFRVPICWFGLENRAEESDRWLRNDGDTRRQSGDHARASRQTAAPVRDLPLNLVYYGVEVLRPKRRLRHHALPGRR
jgi:hypothetical protein